MRATITCKPVLLRMAKPLEITIVEWGIVKWSLSNAVVFYVSCCRS